MLGWLVFGATSMYSRDQGFVFVHIPKTAGTSVYEALGGERDGDDQHGFDRARGIPLQHMTAAEMIDLGYVTRGEFDRCFSFCFVRNPWDRMVSEWKWRCGSALPRTHPYRYLKISLKRFLLEGPSWRGEVGAKIRRHLLPQVAFIRDREGRSLVDFVGRFERLAEDFETACQRADLTDCSLGWAKKTRRGGASYADYYDDETQELVGRMFADDIETFGYEF